MPYEDIVQAVRNFRESAASGFGDPGTSVEAPFDPLNTALKAFQGFITGFTTIPVGDEPENSAEAIAQSIGHLMGFVGVVPGLGSVGSLTAKGISRGLNLVRAGHLLQEGTAIGSGLVKVAQFKSIPMLGADLIMKGFQKTAGVTGAARLVPEFMKTSPYWKIGGGILEGSQHLGFASAISNWTGGVDQMMDSYLHGAIAGGAFRAFGEIFPQPLAKGERLVGSDFWTKFKGNVQDPRGLARIFSSALFTGLPSTNADEPFELQVYNYLLGAYFGVNEMSQSQRNIARFLTGEPYEALKGSGLEPDAAMVRMRLADYKSLPGWKKLSETEKQEVEHQIAMDGIRAVNLQINGELFNISEGGISLNKLQYKALEDYNKDLMEQFKSGNMSSQEYQEKISRPMKDLVGAQIVKRFIDKNEQKIKNNEELDPKDILDVMSEMGKEVTELAEMSKVLRTEEKKTRSYMKELENREIAPILDSIQAALIENKQLETNSNMLYPIKAIVDYSFTAKAQAGEAPPSKEKYFERVKEVVELVRRHSPESEEPSKSDKFQKFIESFQDKYELTSAFESQEQYSNFRRVWLREKYLKDIPMSAYNVDIGRLEPTKGKSQWKAFPFIETVLDAYLGRDANGNSQVGYENIKEIVTYKSGKREVVTETPTYKDIYEAKMGNDSEQDGLKQIQKKLYEQGKSILFGVKDDANLIVTNIIVPGASAKQKLNYSIEYLRRLQHIAKTEGMTKQFKQAMKNINGKEMETVAYVNNLMTLELLNGFKPGEGLATMFNKKNLGKFLMFPNKLNKRTSLLNNGFLPFEPSLLRIPGMEIKDSDGNTVKVGIFQAIDKDISLNSKVPDLTEPVMINGKVVEGHKTGTHVDGAIWVRSDLYDAMMRGGGLPWDSGAQKGTLVHSDPGKGMLLGKFAYHRASPEMSEAMMKAGLHMSLNTTSAKMFGLRDLYKWQYNPDSKSYNFYNSKNEQIYGEKPQEDLTKLKKIDLYKRAKELGIKNISKAKKEDLIKAIQEKKASESITAKQILTERDKYPTPTAIKDAKTILGKRFNAKFKKFQETNKPVEGRDKEIEEGRILEDFARRVVAADKLGIKDINADLIGAANKVKPTEKTPEVMKWEEIPMMSFTFTEGGEGSKPNNRSISTRKQMATVASDKIFGNVRNWLNQKSLEAFRGDLIENTRYEDWVSKGTVDPETIDVNKLSIKYKLEILYGGADSPLWRKLIKEYTKQWESDPEEFDSEVQRNNAYMEEQYSALQKLMTLWENDPASMMSKPLRKRVEMFVGSAIRDEIVRPKVPAMETIMSPYSADIMSKFPDFKPGEIILHENNRQEKIQWGKERKEVTLEQALEEYNKETDATVKKQMENDLTLVGVRVPLSAPNGVRALRIAGFSGIKGRGAIFHPEDMKNMDGADLDIDKAVLYKNLPQDAIGDVLRAKDLQHKYYIRSSGKVVSDALYDRLGASRVESLVKSGKLGSFFTSPKEDLRFRVDQKEPINTNPFAVGDPMVMSKINEYSYWGKRSLGGGINIASNIESLMGFPEGAIKGLERRPDAERSFRKAKTTFINEAADASDGVHLKKLWDMQWELIKSAYNLKEDFFPTKVTRNDKGEIVKQRPYYTKDEKTNRTIAHPEAEWIKREPTLKDITSQDIWIALSSLNKYAKNRDNFYRPITFHESTIASRRAIQKNLSQYMDKANPFVKAMERVSEIDMNNLSLEFGEVPFLGGEFNNNSRLIEKLLRDNPILASIMGRYNTRLHNSLRNSKSYKEWKAKSVFFASEQLKELYSQDIFDMTSIFMINQFLPKDAGKQVTFFKDMHDEVWRWKKKYTRMINDRGFEGRFDILAEANREYAQLQFKYKEHKDLIDAFALSSLYPQFKDIEELRHDRKQAGIKYYDSRVSGIKRELKKLEANFAKNSEVYSKLQEDLKNVRQERKGWIDGTSKEWKEANAELTKNHMESNLANWLYEVPNISNKVIARQNTVYRGIIGASKQKLTKEDLNELDKYIEQPEITPDIVYKDPTAFTERQREKYILATKAPSPEFEGLDPKVKADMEKALEYIDQYLKKYPQYIGQLDAIFSGVQEGKTWVAAQRTLVGPRIAQPADIIEVGNFLKKVLDNAGKPIPLQKKHWIFYTPQKIGEALTTYDPVLISKQVPVIESFGPEKGAMREILSFNSTAGRVAEAHNNGQLNERAWHQKIENKWQEHPLEIVTKQLDKLHDGLGSKLWDIVLAKREMSVGKNRDGSERTSLYREIWEKVEVEYNKLAEDKSVYSIPYLRGAKLTAKQLMDKMQKAATKWSEESANTYIRNKEAEQDFFYDKYGRKRTGIWSFGYINVSRAVDELGKRLSKGDQTILGANLLNRIGHQIRMENIELNAANGAILYLNKAISRRDFGRILKGERKYADKPEGQTYTPEEIRNLSEYKEWLKGNSEWNKTDNFEKTMINYYFKAIQNGKDFIKVRDVVQPKDRAILLDALKFSKLNETGWMEYKDIEFRPDWFEKYFPHLDHSREGIKIWIKDKLTRMRKENKALTDIVSEKEIAQRELIEGQSGYDKLSHNFQEMMEQRITEKSIVEPNINAKFSLGRNKDFPIPEWSRELGAMRKYEQQMATFYWRSVANLLSQKHIEGLRKSQALGKNTEQWIKFLQVYNRDQIGYPAVIPAEWSQDKEFESSLQPYWVFTNNFAKQVADKIGYTQFSGKKLYKELGDIVSEKEWEALTPQEQRALRNLVDAGIDKKLMGISSLEAKWNLISLLSHTKTLVNNMIGGKVNVFASTGLSDYRKANNLTYMKENIFTMMPPGKEVRGMEDVLRIMEEAGGLEMMFRIEADLAGTNKAYSLKSFFEEAIPTLKGGKFSAEGLRDLAKKHKISDRLLETSGWFMRWSEVKLRKQAWLAHYIKAKETLDALGMVLEYNHPWLFQMANKGVAGTQFLYNQANRPAFARTPLGKIFSRFQLWAWNSVKFRKDVLAEIERIGYKANSAEANRVQRLMTADLFMFALAGIFPASIFESNLAPPMSYLEDLAAFFFGDKKEKERAFYGVLPYPFAPLQAISPPSTRVLYNTLSLAVNGDLDTFGSRVMSWMPFGRFTQSIYRTIDSPKMFVENFAGIPIHRMTGWKKKVGESERLIYSPTTLFK